MTTLIVSTILALWSLTEFKPQTSVLTDMQTGGVTDEEYTND
jgi:hypothetical protein